MSVKNVQEKLVNRPVFEDFKYYWNSNLSHLEMQCYDYNNFNLLIGRTLQSQNTAYVNQQYQITFGNDFILQIRFVASIRNSFNAIYRSRVQSKSNGDFSVSLS